MSKGQELYSKAKSIIPGGTMLLSKRPEMFLPDFWPSYYSKSKGCEVWDLDDNHYFDFSYMGVGSCILGYADEDIDKEVVKAINKGNMNTLNAPEEVELAELLISLHPWAEMVRFARTGGEANTVAIRIARAYTRKDVILCCGYHGWHDWYLASNLANDQALDGHLLPGLTPAGVPRCLQNTTVPFNFNETEEFINIFNANKGNIAAVIIEPVRNEAPDKNFYSTIRSFTAKNNIPLIFDEITSGWRINLGGAHLFYNLEPDIAVFGKGMSNGYPMAAILGKKQFMQAAQDSFISSTYWTDRLGPVAALASIQKMRECNVQRYLISIGKEIKKIWMNASEETKLNIRIYGLDSLAQFEIINEKSLESKTLFIQRMLEGGFLASNSFYASFAHKQKFLSKYKEKVISEFKLIKKVQKNNSFDKYLWGDICHKGFKRLN